MTDERMGLTTIKVNKAQLIATLTVNRDAHMTEYLKAIEVYKQEHLRQAESIVSDARRGVIRRSITIPVPEEHTDDYNRAIEILEWALTDEVWLSQQEFAQYVRNEWGWLKSYQASTASYLVTNE